MDEVPDVSRFSEVAVGGLTAWTQSIQDARDDKGRERDQG